MEIGYLPVTFCGKIFSAVALPGRVQTRERSQVEGFTHKVSAWDSWMSVRFVSNFIEHRSIIDSRSYLMMLRIFQSKSSDHVTRDIYKYQILYFDM